MGLFSSDQIAQGKEIFGEYMDLLDSRAGVNAQINEALERAASVLSIKKKKVRKLFAALKKRMEGNEEIEELQELLEEFS